MSAAMITPQTAPRDLEALIKVGVFQLRILIRDLGGLTTPEQQAAFAGMDLNTKANLAMQLLQQLDKSQGGPPMQQQMQQPPQQQMQMQAPQQQYQQPPPQQQMAPAPHMNGTVNGMGAMAAPASYGGGGGMVQQPMGAMQQMPMGGMQAPAVASVDPSALAHAQTAAAGAAQQTSGRKPRNSSASNGESSELGAEVLKLLTQLTQQQQANNEAILQGLKEFTATVDNLAKQDSKKNLDSLSQSYAGVYNVLREFDGRLTRIEAASQLSISLSLFLAEQVLGAPRPQILQAAAADIPSIQGFLNPPQQQQMGKA